MSKLLGNRMNDWRTFMKKSNDAELYQKQKDDKYGQELLDKLDKERGLLNNDQTSLLYNQ